MSQTIFLGSSVKVVQKETLNMEELYNLITNWLKLNGYGVYEIAYSDLLEGTKKIIKVSLHCENDRTDYIRFIIEPSFNFTNVKLVDVKKDGKNTKANKADIEINIKYFIEKDYDNFWSKGTYLGRFARDIYDNYIINKKLTKLDDELIKHVKLIMEEIKTFLNLHKNISI